MSLPGILYKYPLRVVFSAIIISAFVLPLSGCQKLFRDDDAIFKGRTVSVAYSVPETPPPAAKPIVREPSEKAPVSAKPPLDNRLLPTQEPVKPSPAFTPAVAVQPVAASQREPIDLTRADLVMDGRTITEDTVLRGTVVIRGTLVVAPQATLRIEPGSTLRFAAPPNSGQLSRLVVYGRIVCAGTASRPVLLAPAFEEPRPSDWGGVLLLMTEKRNQFDNCRIEGAWAGVEGRHSHIYSKGLSVSRCNAALLLYDSVASINGASLSRSDAGLRLIDSELDLRDSRLWENRQGLSALRSSLSVSSSMFERNSQEGFAADQCRFRINGSTFSENRVGAHIKAGDGHVTQSGFFRNRDDGALFSGARTRIRNCSLENNGGAGLRVDAGEGTVTGSSIASNSGGNLIVDSTESFSAVLNWWGADEDRAVAAGILDKAPAGDMRHVHFRPFLSERPALAP